MKFKKLNLSLELSLSVPLSWEVAGDLCIHEEVIRRLQSVLDDMGEEYRYFHDEISRLQKKQEDFLQGKHLH